MKDGGREILLEYVVMGKYARVCAVDAETGLEAVAQGPAHARRADLEKLACEKLARALAAADKPPGRNGVFA